MPALRLNAASTTAHSASRRAARISASAADVSSNMRALNYSSKSKRAALSRLMKRDVDDIIAAEPRGYRRRARLSLNYQPKTQQLQMGFRKANSSEIIDVVQCPVLVPQLEALLPAVRECLTSLQSQRQLGHVELVQADNGPLMVFTPYRRADGGG